MTETEQSLYWTEKHRPKTFGGIQANTKALDEIKQWAEEWERGDKPQLLVGDAGVGKTATVHALANDMEWMVEDINASSARKKEDIESLVRRMRANSVSGKRQLVFLDEVDSLHHSTTLTPLVNELSNPESPVILAGNEEWKMPNSIKQKCNKHTFKLGKRSIKARLKQIAKEEGVSVDARQIGQLATRGNLRAAINDLQRYAESGVLGWDDRETEIGNFQAVDNVLKGKRYTGEMTPDEQVVWLNENLSTEFRGLELHTAYDALARADKWLGRTRDSQDYRWWRYAGRLADAPADLRLLEPYGGWMNKNYPQHYRSSTPSFTDKDATAALYRTLKNTDSGMFGFAGSYIEFRRDILPRILESPEETRLQLALDTGLKADDSAVSALDITEKQYEEWLYSEIDVQHESNLNQW